MANDSSLPSSSFFIFSLSSSFSAISSGLGSA
nr:MAG TPA: hypothetical protein [Caudoviricetes sp.]